MDKLVQNAKPPPFSSPYTSVTIYSLYLLGITISLDDIASPTETAHSVSLIGIYSNPAVGSSSSISFISSFWVHPAKDIIKINIIR